MPVMKVPATDLRSAAPSVFHEVFRIVFHGMRCAYSPVDVSSQLAPLRQIGIHTSLEAGSVPVLP